MTKELIWDELERIHCTSKYVGNIEGLEVCENCGENYWHIFNDHQSVLIIKREIDNIFKKLSDKCGLRKFWDEVRNNSLCSYSEHILD